MEFHADFNEPPVDTDKNFIKFGAAVTVAMMLVLAQFIHWGSDSLSIIPLKIKTWAGIASLETYREIRDICQTRQKYGCVADAYEGMTRLYPHDLPTLLEYADLSRHLGHYSKALRAYDTYLRLGGAEVATAQYGRGQSLAALGDVDSAILAYDQAIAAKPEVIQKTVTEAYLELLLKNSRFKKAKQVIAEARKRGRARDLFAQFDPDLTH